MTIDERIEALTLSMELLNESHVKTENTLRRAIRLAVKEGRSLRNRSREADQKITQLASAQLVTEEKLAELAAAQKVTEGLFQAWLKRGGNGHS
jgi:hypothetical protein